MAKEEKVEEKKVDLAEIQASLERDRADLASRILDKLPSSSTTSTSTFNSTPTPTFNPNLIARPANLGLGATPKNQPQNQNHSLQESRLKGRLLQGSKKNHTNDNRESNLEREGEEVEKEQLEQEEEDSRSASLKRNYKSVTSDSNTISNGKRKGKNKEQNPIDPFSIPPPTLSKKEKKRRTREALEHNDDDGNEAASANKNGNGNGNVETNEDSTMQSLVTSDENSMQEMSKSQRKKMRKKIKMAMEKEEDGEGKVQVSGEKPVVDGGNKEGQVGNQIHTNVKTKGKGKEKSSFNQDLDSNSKTIETGPTSSSINDDNEKSNQEEADSMDLEDSESEFYLLPNPTTNPTSNPFSSSSSSSSSIPTSTISRSKLPTFQTSSQSTLTSSLSGAQFRSLNQSLYTLNSSKALEMIQKEPKLMEAYHQGFRDQTKKWPMKPVEIIGKKLREGQIHSYSFNQKSIDGKKKEKNKNKSNQNEEEENQIMMEMEKKSKGRFSENLIVVDLGCGEAPLARSLSTSINSTTPDGKDITLPSIPVLSYDLLSSKDGWVQGADVASENGVPLPGRNQGVREKAVRNWIWNLDLGKDSKLSSENGNGNGNVEINDNELSKKKKRKRGNLLLSSNNAAASSSATSSSNLKNEKEIKSTTEKDEISVDDGGAICDVVVYCLCLMGTNWIEMIREGRRILKTGGELIIAEVSSRMTSTDSFIEIIETLGFQLGEKDLTSNTHFQLYSFVKSNPSTFNSTSSKQSTSKATSRSKSIADSIVSNFFSQSSSLVSESSSTEEKKVQFQKLLKHAMKEDEISEKELIENRGEVLKPCLYKRR